MKLTLLANNLMKKEKPKSPGRPKLLDRGKLKKNRTLSFSDSEYANLSKQAEAAGLDKSNYIIQKLDL